MSGKKFLTPERFGKKFWNYYKISPIPHSPTNVQWSCQPFRGWGKKRIWFIMWWFSRLRFCISRCKIRRWKTQMERESSKECSVSFLWTNESFSLWNCLSRNSTLFSIRQIGALGLFWANQGSEVSEGIEVHSALYDQRKVLFSKGIVVFIKVSWTFSTFWNRRKRKTTKCAFEIVFFAVCSTNLTCVNASI